MSHRAADVLTSFDRAAETYDFPVLDNANLVFFSQRLLVLRTAEAWAVVFELGAILPVDGPVTGSALSQYKFGSRLRGDAGFTNDDVGVACFSNGSGKPIWSEDRADESEAWFVDPAAESIVVCGTEVAIGHRDAWYAEVGVTLRTPGRPQCLELYRAIAARHPDLVRAPDAKRRERLDTDAPVVLDLVDWWHPDFGEKPSDSPALRQIARVVETGDVREFDRSAPANSHWRHWPEQGCNKPWLYR